MSGENTETLHLINLERQNIGEYSCSSKNDLGENHSSTITLRVQCEFIIYSVHLDCVLFKHISSVFFCTSDAPRCKPGTEQSSVGSINMHSIDVRCEVDADPAEHIRFSWTYNNTRNVSPVCKNKWNNLHKKNRYFCFSKVQFIERTHSRLNGKNTNNIARVYYSLLKHKPNYECTSALLFVQKSVCSAS